MGIFNRAKFNNNFKLFKDSNEITVYFKGDLDYKQNYKNLLFIKKEISNFDSVVFDFKELVDIDYSIAFFIMDLVYSSDKIKILNLLDKFDKILSIFSKEYMQDIKYKQRKFPNIFNDIGKGLVNSFNNFITFCQFIGEFILKFLFLLINPKYFRPKEVSNYIRSAGIDAILIVCLTSFLIGFVLAYIGALMLSKFGAGIYIVDVMGILALREIGPLIAAIVVAGRSASSFTAQIGVMKLTEEVDAMRTMGFDPFYFLVMPRVTAMILSMPIIIFLSDAANIIGQMIISYIVLDINFYMYLEQFKSSVSLNNFLVGIIKAPFYGLLIANIGCLRGLEVDDNSQSIGRLTTTSVVNSIFAVIAIDAVAAIIFTQIGY